MARRVNTAFVIGLGGTLAVIAVVAASFFVINWKRQRDPKFWINKAEIAEKAGNLKDAAGNYQRAANAAARTHTAGADELFAKVGDLCMNLSKTSTAEQDAVVYYQTAVAAYEQAETENPRNQAVIEKRLDLAYERAQINGKSLKVRLIEALSQRIVTGATIRDWTDLEEVATHLINNQKTPVSKPYLYRAEARLRQVQTRALRDTPETRFDEIAPDVQKAMEFDPASVNAIALNAELAWTRARAAAGRRGVANPNALRDDSQYAKEVQDIQARLSDLITTKGMNSGAASLLAQIMLEQYGFLDATSPASQKTMDGAIALLDKAYQADTSNYGVGEAVGWLYSANGLPDKAENIFKDMITQHPGSPDGYYLLAEFFRDTKREKEAKAVYKDMLAHVHAGGGGLEAQRDSYFELYATDSIAWLSMDLAEIDGDRTKEGQEEMAESAALAEKLRTSHAVPGMTDLLDGRAQFIARNLPLAMTTLHRAETKFNGVPEMAERLRQTKILLAKANELQHQTGAALSYLSEALDIKPNDLQVILQRASLQLQLAQYSEVKSVMEELLKREKSLSPGAVTVVKTMLASAEQGLGNKSAAVAIMKSAGALVQLASTYLESGDYEDALAEANQVLEKEAENKDADNVTAYQITIVAQSQLKHKDLAIAAVNRALLKYPQNATFQVIKAQLTSAEGGDPVEIQKKIIEAISDEYTKQMRFSVLYNQQHKSDDEIAALKMAEKSLGDAASSEDRDKLNEVISRIFDAASTAALRSKDNKDKAETYWKLAETYVQRAEKLNLDGTGGKLFRGRYELMRSDGKNGLQFIEQAVAQRPDYGTGHQVLGQAYYSQHNFAQALDEFRQVIHIAPNNVAALQYAIALLVRKGDPTSMKEAQGLLEGGLQIAPRNTAFVDDSDILGDIDQAIRRREGIRKNYPDNLDNVGRLALLYVRNKDKDKQAVEKAINIVKPLYEKSQSDLELANLLARLYAETGSEDMINKGIVLYDPFIKGSDAKVKFDALVGLGEFCSRARRIDAAVAAFRDAIGIEPAGSEEAERHLGDLYFEQGDMANAGKVYDEIIQKAKGAKVSDSVVRRAIEAQIRQGEFGVADAAGLKHNALLDDLLKRLPDDEQALVLRGYSSIQQRRLPDAMKDLDHALTVNADNVDAHYYRALAQVSLGGDLDLAVKDLLAARNRDRTAVTSRLLLAQIYRQTQRYGEASIEYSDIMEAHPDLVSVRVEYANFLLELVKIDQHLPADSDEEFAANIRRLKPADKLFVLVNDAAKLYPSEPFWPMTFADLLAAQGSVLEAQDVYKKLYAAVPDDLKICNAYLGSLLKTKNYEEVIPIASKVIQKNPTLLDFYLKRAEAYVGMKKQADALADLDSAFDLSSKAAEQLKSFSPFLTTLGYASDIVPADVLAAHLRERQAANPNDPLYPIALMNVLAGSGHFTDAVAVADSIKLRPEDGTLRNIVLRSSSVARYQAHQYDGAYKDFMELLKSSPDDVDSLNNVAFMLADSMKQPDKAIPYAQHALDVLASHSSAAQVSGSAASVYDTLGWAKYLNDDMEGAISAFRKSVNLQPMPATYLHLATAYKKNKRTQDAQQAVQDGLKIATAARSDTLRDLESMKKELDIK